MKKTDKTRERSMLNRNLKLWLRATAALSCLFMLSTSFYSSHATVTTTESIFSSVVIIYSSSATLFFRSGFEEPVEYYLRYSYEGKLRYGDSPEGVVDSWSDLDHAFRYVHDWHTSDSGDTYIDDSKAHSGSRSLYGSVFGPKQRQNRLLFFHNDNDFGNEIFVRQWSYYPEHFLSQFLSSDSELCVIGSREKRNTSAPPGDPDASFAMGLDIEKFGDVIGWEVEAVDYSRGTSYYNDWLEEPYGWHYTNKEVSVPVGKWFAIEWYVLRGTFGKGRVSVRIKVDGQYYTLFDLHNIRTKNDDPRVQTKILDLECNSGTLDYPVYHWVDDIEIWNGMPPEEPINPPTYLDDGFEDGNFDAWTANISNSGSSIDIASDQVLHGNRSVKVTGVNAINDYALLYKTLEEPAKEYYLRAYFMIDTLPANGTEANIAIRLKDQTNRWYLGELYLRNYSMTLQGGLYYYHNGVQYMQWTSKTYSVNTWYSIQIHVKCGNGNGEVQLWWDEELLFNQTSLNNDGNIERAYVGVAMWRGNPFSLGTAYFDCVKLDSQYIGCARVHFTVEEVEEGPIPNVKINRTHLTDDVGCYEWTNLAYNNVYTFVVEKPSGYYPAWVLNVEGSFSWNGTHYLISHKVTETQTDPIEIYFFPAEEVYIKSSTRKLMWVYYGSSSHMHSSMRFNISADIGATSQMEIYTADEGHPRPYKIEGATDWSYDSLSKILTIWILHTSEEEAEIEWRGAAMGQ